VLVPEPWAERPAGSRVLDPDRVGWTESLAVRVVAELGPARERETEDEAAVPTGW
jgi:hypothetical protein